MKSRYIGVHVVCFGFVSAYRLEMFIFCDDCSVVDSLICACIFVNACRLHTSCYRPID